MQLKACCKKQKRNFRKLIRTKTWLQKHTCRKYGRLRTILRCVDSEFLMQDFLCGSGRKCAGDDSNNCANAFLPRKATSVKYNEHCRRTWANMRHQHTGINMLVEMDTLGFAIRQTIICIRGGQSKLVLLFPLSKLRSIVNLSEGENKLY